MVVHRTAGVVGVIGIRSNMNQTLRHNSTTHILLPLTTLVVGTLGNGRGVATRPHFPTLPREASRPDSRIRGRRPDLAVWLWLLLILLLRGHLA